jgi:hypothetical protein
MTQCVPVLKQLLGEDSLHYYLASIRTWQILEQVFAKANNIKLINALQMILPSPQEIMFEMQRSATRRAVLGEFNNDLNLYKEVWSMLIEPPTGSNISLSVVSKVQSTSNDALSPLEGKLVGGGLAGDVGDLLCSLHCKFLLLGFIHLTHINTMNSYPSSYIVRSLSMARKAVNSVRNGERVFAALFEILSYSMHDTISPQRTVLAPLLANIMLKLSLSVERDASMDWIYWNLAKVGC